MKKQLYTTVGLVVAIIIMLNLLAREFHFRLDLTNDRQYTLSTATRDLLERLDEPVSIKAYFSQNLPPNVQKARSDFQDLLVEYASRSNGQLSYAFINPNANEQKEQEATEKGIQPVMINVREKDQMKQQKAYLGAIVSIGEKQEVIPVIQPGTGMEYALSTAIKKLSISQKPKLGILGGHGEASIYEMPQLNQQLQVLYDPEPVPLSDSTDIPAGLKTLIVIRPSDSIPEPQLAKLDAFLARGGRLLLALNRIGGNFQYGQTNLINTGLESWLAKKGLQMGNNLVIDAQCASVPVQQQQGPFTMQVQVQVPYIPVISSFAKHPVTSGLETMMLEFASTVKFSGDSSLHFTPLAFTSKLSDSLAAPVFLEMNKDWKQEDFKTHNLPVAGALEGPLAGKGSPAGKLVLITDGDFVVNGPPPQQPNPMMPQQPQQQQQRQVEPDNVNFVSNAIDWLSDDTGLISLRTKGVSSRPIAELEDGTKTTIKYLNFLLPVLLAIGYGIWRARRNRAIRNRRMAETY